MIETKFSLALDKNGIQRDVYAKQGEKHARTCQITLTVGGKVVPITGYALEMYFDDDPPTSLPITNNGNPISFEIPDGLCITPGERICELRISKDDTENIIYAPQFRVIIEGTLGSSGTPTPVGEVTLYQPLIGGLTTYSSTLDGDEYVPVYDPDLGESQKMLVTSFLDGKVDKVTGKGLSTNDFTDALKSKLDSVAQSDWNQADSTALDYIKNKPTIPSKTSDLTNDSGFITTASIPTKTSDLTNDSGFITEASIPTKTSDLTNDSGFITDVKDVNGTSLVTSGVANLLDLPFLGYTSVASLSGANDKVATLTDDIITGKGWFIVRGLDSSSSGYTGTQYINSGSNSFFILISTTSSSTLQMTTGSQHIFVNEGETSLSNNIIRCLGSMYGREYYLKSEADSLLAKKADFLPTITVGSLSGYAFTGALPANTSWSFVNGKLVDLLFYVGCSGTAHTYTLAITNSTGTTTYETVTLAFNDSLLTEDDIQQYDRCLGVCTTENSTKMIRILSVNTWGRKSSAQVQSDWTQSNSSAVDYIKNKPALSTVATSGSYTDLSNTPTIPSAGDITSSTSTGYAVAGDVCNAIGDVESALAALIGGES